MTLDEAIKFHEESANREAENAEWFDLGDDSSEMFREKYEKCREHAKEHRQLAEWLKELKELKNRVQQNDKAILEIQKDFKGYVDLLDMPRDDYNGIMEYIDELSSVTPRAESEDKT